MLSCVDCACASVRFVTPGVSEEALKSLSSSCRSPSCQDPVRHAIRSRRRLRSWSSLRRAVRIRAAVWTCMRHSSNPSRNTWSWPSGGTLASHASKSSLLSRWLLSLNRPRSTRLIGPRWEPACSSNVDFPELGSPSSTTQGTCSRSAQVKMRWVLLSSSEGSSMNPSFPRATFAVGEARNLSMLLFASATSPTPELNGQRVPPCGLHLYVFVVTWNSATAGRERQGSECSRCENVCR